jgi:hypothetical protein
MAEDLRKPKNIHSASGIKSGESPGIDRAHPVQGRTIFFKKGRDMEEEVIVLGVLILSSVSFTLMFQWLLFYRR